MEAHHANTPHSSISNEEVQEFSFRASPLSIRDLGKAALEQEEFLQTKLPISPCNNSPSPTALGLLLRSSMFRELVKKNSNATTEEETGLQNDRKNQPRVGCSGDEYGGMFYSNINVGAGVGAVPFAASSSSKSGKWPRLEAQEMGSYNR